MTDSPNLFSELCAIQQDSNDLVVWSVLAAQLVTVTYPVAMTGLRVDPKGFRNWLTRRGLHLNCFCAATFPTGESCSCRIVTAIDGNVFAFCAQYPMKCGFFIDVTSVHRSATLQSHFSNLPTTREIPDMNYLKNEFMNHVEEAPYLLNDSCPYFSGYCGEHSSQYPNITQLHGSSTPGTATTGFRRAEGKKTAADDGSPYRRTLHLYTSGSRYSPLGKGKAAVRSLTPAQGSSSSLQQEASFATAAANLFATSGSSNIANNVLSHSDLELIDTLRRGDGISGWEPQSVSIFTSVEADQKKELLRI
ncbi:hypothetical protein HYPSUDRAFT_203874 [Hypholoma sublateritium FD-334 SS-4]|uniref:Uncharacterized protein n=1 Tax=Hypholoma sublateritium (strain FD-334 SS-4) TaxID=945553 RepID=A0A0D2L126_HYPSF|nr:hypothetical protein HYPSUDRAFT_203874 [Hypholoma sublateritium FD-334 SS-4]